MGSLPEGRIGQVMDNEDYTFGEKGRYWRLFLNVGGMASGISSVTLPSAFCRGLKKRSDYGRSLLKRCPILGPG